MKNWLKLRKRIALLLLAAAVISSQTVPFAVQAESDTVSNVRMSKTMLVTGEKVSAVCEGIGSSIQWQSSDSVDGEWTDIEGATSAEFTPSDDLSDQYVRCVVDGVNGTAIQVVEPKVTKKEPSADTYGQSDRGDEVLHDEDVNHVHGNGKVGEADAVRRNTFMKFDILSFEVDKIKSAFLKISRLYSKWDGGQINVQKYDDDSWTEEGLTYNNSDGFDRWSTNRAGYIVLEAEAASDETTRNKYIDIKDYIKEELTKNETVTSVAITTEMDQFFLTTRHNENADLRPYLFITELPYEVASVAPVSSDVQLTLDGDKLTGSYTYSDANADTEVGTTYKLLAADEDGAYKEVTSGTTTAEQGVSYTLTDADYGKSFKLEITPKDSTDISGTSVESEKVEVAEKETEAATAVTEAAEITFSGDGGVVIGGQEAAIEDNTIKVNGVQAKIYITTITAGDKTVTGGTLTATVGSESKSNTFTKEVEANQTGYVYSVLSQSGAVWSEPAWGCTLIEQ